MEYTIFTLRISCLEGVLSASCRQPGVFMPSPTQAGQQTVDMIAGVTHAEPPPDQAGDSFRGPDWVSNPCATGPCFSKSGSLARFSRSNLGRPPVFGRRRNPSSPRVRCHNAHRRTDCMLTPNERAIAEVDSPCCSRAMAANRRASNFLGRGFHIPSVAATPTSFQERIFVYKVCSRTKMGVSGRRKETARAARIPLRSGNPIRPYRLEA